MLPRHRHGAVTTVDAERLADLTKRRKAPVTGQASCTFRTRTDQRRQEDRQGPGQYALPCPGGIWSSRRSCRWRRQDRRGGARPGRITRIVMVTATAG